MRIAVPIWNQRISPVFDVATELLVADVEGQEVHSQAIRTLHETDPMTRTQVMVAFGIQILICGAISQAMEHLLRARGIRVISRKCGEAAAILQAYVKDRIDDLEYALPGCEVSLPDDAPVENVSQTMRDADDEVTCCDEVSIRLEGSADTAIGTRRGWTALVNGSVVSSLDLEHDQQQGRITRFEIRPGWHRSPAPCRLLQEALSHCRRRGVLKLTVDAAVRTRQAMRLFACLGFQRNHRHGRRRGHPAEFYLNLYKRVDEDRCANELKLAHQGD